MEAKHSHSLLNWNLNGRVALVTGGARGIGRATCLALAEMGAAVVVHYRSHEEEAAALVEQIKAQGGKATALQADFAQVEAPQQLVETALNQMGHIDILVNNAGDMPKGAVDEVSDEILDYTFTVNLMAAFRCTRACLPNMKQRAWGRIISVSSQSAFSGSINYAHYAASKSGLAGFSYSLAKEVGAQGITVNVVAPGRIVTDLILPQIPTREEEWSKQTPMRRLGQPEEVAAAIAFLASESASYITGATIHVNGGLVMS